MKEVQGNAGKITRRYDNVGHLLRIMAWEDEGILYIIPEGGRASGGDNKNARYRKLSNFLMTGTAL
jgi:hypothetical protein